MLNPVTRVTELGTPSSSIASRELHNLLHALEGKAPSRAPHPPQSYLHTCRYLESTDKENPAQLMLMIVE